MYPCNAVQSTNEKEWCRYMLYHGGTLKLCQVKEAGHNWLWKSRSFHTNDFICRKWPTYKSVETESSDSLELRGLGEVGSGCWRVRLSLWCEEDILMLVVVMVVFNSASNAKNHWWVHFKWINCMVYELYFYWDIIQKLFFKKLSTYRSQKFFHRTE